MREPRLEGRYSLLSRWLAFLPLLTVLHVFAAVVYPSDPDLGYHLAIGEHILSAGAFPEADLFRINSDAPEVAYSWLPDLTLAWTYRYFGVDGLRAWVMLSALVLSLVLIALVGDSGRQWQICVALVTLSIGLLQICGPRPRLWAAICLVLLLLKLRNRTPQLVARECLAIGLIVAFWANVHVSATLAPLFVFIAQGVRATIMRNRKAWTRCAGLTFASSAAVLINPYSYRLFAMGFEFSPWTQRSIADSIVEMRGLLNLPAPYPIWVYALVFLTIWALYRAVKQRLIDGVSLEDRAQSLGILVIVLVCLLLTINSSRHANFLLISAAATLGLSGRKVKIVNGAPLTGLATYLLVSASGLAAASPGRNWYDVSFSSPTYPERALESASPLLQSPRDDGARWSIFAPFGKGHFITWWLRERGLSNAAAVFVDGRTDYLGRERFFTAQSIFREPCEEDLLALGADVILVEESSDLFEVLLNSPNFIPLGGDQIVAFAKMGDIENRF